MSEMYKHWAVKWCLLFLFCSSGYTGATDSSLEWWQSEVIYQIYPRSFKDSNRDGIGDLNGVFQNLSYIKNLGVGAIWFSPIMASPMVDFGYDILNYERIDPTYGTMDYFDRLLKKAHKLGLKILLDFVPNHTSDQHEWFQNSIKCIEPYTDYYVWRDAKYIKGNRFPPNNWISSFGKSAWQWNEERRQYYLHQFSIEQPDLNYRNRVVYEEMKNVMKFWLEKGVDGFRVDAISALYENISYPDEPRSNQPFVTPDEYQYLNHIYSTNQPETFDLVKDWRRLVDKYSVSGQTRFMMSESVGDLNTIMKFYGTKDSPGVHFPFNFMMLTSLNAESNATSFADVIKKWYKFMPEGAWANWVIGNHDSSRPASRFDPCLIDGLTMLQMLLPGTPIVYSGDELGMQDTFIRWDQTHDPPALNAGPLRYKYFSRDPARSPFQWDNTKNAGFSKGIQTWLPVNPNYWTINVQEQLKKHQRLTHLQIFKQLVNLRKDIVFQEGDFHVHVLSDWVISLIRTYLDHSTYIVVVNLGSEEKTSNLYEHRPSLPPTVRVLIPSVNSQYNVGDILSTTNMHLRPKAAVVLTTCIPKRSTSNRCKYRNSVQK